ncbi:deoxyguanosine kinase [Marinitoga hydrogenitolerans DSM 16785]|uniref:Deoxyguanosine kinase n=1 Tax=Marinitoga hydrogenitolerans (strain DSM 16785 / JCM 12826 / AT1271) TaxID=1122195 RepID=A0A1M4SPG2_MARH1|nr:deoxynucleoside kinase [Marinitoga hydrogenitolerans]SHE34164.1 deoxyguanosine kinase [Marinitoga hydrogenitolerans DSM 16785]
MEKIKSYFKGKSIRINIEGNIGSGKTTLANALFYKLNADELILEEFENNPYLPLLYKNEDVGFQTEMFFLVSRYKQYHKNNYSNLVISDYDMLKNKIFANITITNPIEKEKFLKIYNILTEDIKKPDVLIYLDTNVDVIVERIKKRNRDMEKVIAREYLELVDNGYKNYFSKEKDFLYVDGNTFNVFDEKELKKLLERIIQYLEGKIWVR